MSDPAERMSHWNYRVTKQVVDGETEYAIREVYYGPGPGQLSWTERPAKPSGETKAELKDALEKMLEALPYPAIDITDEKNPKEEI